MHDAKGQPLAVGDIVLVPAEVTAVQAQDDYCNCSLKALAPMPPYAERNTTLTVNTRQVVRANAGDDTTDAVDSVVPSGDAPALEIEQAPE